MVSRLTRLSSITPPCFSCATCTAEPCRAADDCTCSCVCLCLGAPSCPCPVCATSAAHTRTSLAVPSGNASHLATKPVLSVSLLLAKDPPSSSPASAATSRKARWTISSVATRRRRNSAVSVSCRRLSRESTYPLTGPLSSSQLLTGSQSRELRFTRTVSAASASGMVYLGTCIGHMLVWYAEQVSTFM